MKPKGIKFSLGLGLLLFVSCRQPPPMVIATVNDKVITVDDFRSQWAILRTVRPNQVMDSRTRDQLVDQMVRQQLLVQEAQKRGYDRNPNLNKVVDEQRKKLRGELQKQVDDAKAQLAQLDEAVRSKALIDAMLADYGQGAGPTKLEIEMYYTAQKAKGQNLPPLETVRHQVSQQILLDKLIKEIQGYYAIKINQSVLDSDAITTP